MYWTLQEKYFKMQFTTQATALLFLAHITKLITNTIYSYVSISEQLISFQSFFGFPSGLCHGKVYKIFSF